MAFHQSTIQAVPGCPTHWAKRERDGVPSAQFWAPLFTALLLLEAGCTEIRSPSLVGTWTGEDHTGQPVRLVFGSDNSFDLVDEMGESVSEEAAEGGLRFEYQIVPEVEPKQMYLRLLRGEEVLDQIPFGVYKFEGGKLVVCDASGKQATFWGMPVGPAMWEFPTSYTGKCASYSREGMDPVVLNSLFLQ